MSEAAFLTVKETARFFGLSLNHTYEEIRAGRIPSIRFGNKILVPRRAIDRMVEEALQSGKATQARQ